MNHCRDCNSDYATPGSCNCFAVGGKRYVAPLPAIPYVPYTPWVQPWTPYPGTGPIYIGDSPHHPSITWGIAGGWCDAGSAIAFSGNTPITSDTVKAGHAGGQASCCVAGCSCCAPPAQSIADLAATGRSMTGGDTSHMLDS